MEQDELGGCFVVSVEELGHNGLWSSIKDSLEARALLQNVPLTNKVGQVVIVDNLPVQYVLSSDKRLLRLKPFSHSPVTWFRNPYAHLILVSSAEANDYKTTIKNMISKVVADLEREWGGTTLTCEWIILYIRPFELDVNDRNAKRVFEKLRDDFGRKKRERCIRLDVSSKAFDAMGRRMPALGLEDLELCLKEAVQASFDSRQVAYDDEVKKLVEERLEPAWSFTTLYLVKDSFALMLECAGMLEDALKEYMELELCYLEALQRRAVVSPDFGANNENDDMAQILTASWRETRRAVLKKNGIPEFSFRQYLFAAQARLLLKLGRLLEVGERGLFFINTMTTLLAEKQQQGVVRPFLQETWAFSACLVLVATLSACLSQPEPAQEELATYLNAARSGSIVGTKPDSRKPSQLPALRPASALGAHTMSATGGVNKTMKWDLGLSWSDTDAAPETPVIGGKSILPALFVNLRSSQAVGAQQREVEEKMLYCLLGHMYLLARQQLLALGTAVHFAGPLQTIHGVQLPPALQGFLEPGFGSLSSLTACCHPKSGLSSGALPSNGWLLQQSALGATNSACSSPRADLRSEGGANTLFAPSTPDRHTSSNLPSSSPGSVTSATPTAAPSATPEKSPAPQPFPTAPPATPRTAAASSTGPEALSPAHLAPPVNSEAAAGLVLQSVSEWRLRAALEQQESFDDLVQSLTALTTWCFARAHHWRSAALLGLEQAAMLVQRGALEAGCNVLEQAVVRLEGWGLLHGYLLPHLLAAQAECRHPNLPISLTKLLTLPPAFLSDHNRHWFSKNLHSVLDRVAVSLDMSNSLWRQQQFLAAYTLSNTFSRLCGLHDDSNPLLLPPPRAPAAGAARHLPPPGSRDHVWGACKVCAGDRSYVWLELHNHLEVELELTNVVLVLGLLQPISPTSRVTSLYRQSSCAPQVNGSGWQEAQDVVCQQVIEAAADGSLPASGSWLRSEPSRVRLQPGRTRLVAAIVPTQDGLYTLKHVAASLGGMKLHVPVLRPEEQQEADIGLHAQQEQGQPEPENCSSRPAYLRSTLPATDYTAPPTVWGGATKDGHVAEELVVLAVEAVKQRVECGLAAVGGRLVGGVHPQWLGLLLLPRHDTLQHLFVRLGVRMNSNATGSNSKFCSGGTASHPLADSSNASVELFSGLQCALLMDLKRYEELHKAGSSAGSAMDSVEGTGYSTWVAAERGTIDLSQHPLTGPALLWMQVSASYPSKQVEVVKVQRGGPTDPSGRHVMYAEPHADNRRTERMRSVSLDVNLEYMCGCPRAHSSVLAMPLHPPFNVHLLPTQISSTTTALQVVLQCGLLQGVVITGFELTPQVGLQLTSHVATLAGLLPLCLNPNATATVSLLLQSGITGELPSQQYKDEASVLTITYTLDGDVSSDAGVEVVGRPGVQQCWQAQLPPPPGASLRDGVPSFGGPASTRETQTFQHTFILEFPAGQAAESDLQVELLGPWSGRVGDAVAMSWQVTRLSTSRMQAGTAGGADEMIYFEVAQDSSNWYSVGQGKGMLRLGRHAESVATVEAVVVPQMAGSCPPPGLNLRGVSISASDAYSQEIFIHAA